MKYIDKSNSCEEFDEYVKESKPSFWNKSSSSKRRKLGQHLYNEEQGGLCAYCQDDLPMPRGANKNEIDISHIDHIRQKGNPKFKHLEFNQQNLVLSCKGYSYKTKPPLFVLNENGRLEKNKEKGLERVFCGFYKDNHPSIDFDEEQFLFPTELIDIETYFYYEILGDIVPNPLKTQDEREKAQYTIDLLNLNHIYLKEQRREEYQFFSDTKEELVIQLLSDEFPLNRFHSMLKSIFLQ